jgi:multiple sugar transport system permease protein
VGPPAPVSEATAHPAGGVLGSPARRRGRRASWINRRDRQGRYFVAPFIVLFVAMMIAPLIYAIRESLYTTRLIGGTRFTGLDNYKQVLSSGDFWSGVIHVVIFGAIQIPFMLVVAFFFATIFDLGVARFGRVFRAIFFIPYAVPAVVGAIMWNFLFWPGQGPFVHAANTLGFHNTDFFSSGMIWPTIFVIVIWEWTGYNMIVLYTALKSVPRELVDAAVLYGAPLRKVILRVKLPMVRPAITMLVFLNMIGALQMFVEPEIITQFQPQAVSNHFTPTIFIYNTGVAGQEYGQAAAAAVVLGLVTIAISVTVLVLRRRREEVVA